MIKHAKRKLSLIAFLFIFSTSLLSSERFTPLYEKVESENKSLVLKYNVSDRELLLVYKDWEEAQYDFQIRLPVKSNELVSRAKDEINELFTSRIKFNDTILAEVSQELHSLYHLNPSDLEVIHFPLSPERFEDSSKEKLLSLIRSDFNEEVFKSINLFDFNVGESQFFAHGILNSDNDFVRISFSLDGKSFDERVIEYNNDLFVVRDSSGNLEFVVDIDQDMKQLRVVINNDDMITRHVFFHHKTGKGVTVTTPVADEKLLTTTKLKQTETFINHYPVIKLGDQYVPGISRSEVSKNLKALFSSFPTSDSEKEFFLSNYKKKYLRCLGERSFDANSLDFQNLDTIRSECILYSEISLFRTLIDRDKSNIFNNPVISSEVAYQEANHCLVNAGALRPVSELLLINNKLTSGETEKIFGNCLSELPLNHAAALVEKYLPLLEPDLHSLVATYFEEKCQRDYKECMNELLSFKELYHRLDVNEKGVTSLSKQCVSQSERPLKCLADEYLSSLEKQSVNTMKSFFIHSDFLSGKAEGFRRYGLTDDQVLRGSEFYTECLNEERNKVEDVLFSNSIDSLSHSCGLSAVKELMPQYIRKLELSLASSFQGDEDLLSPGYLGNYGRVLAIDSVDSLDKEILNSLIYSKSSLLSEVIYSSILGESFSKELEDFVYMSLNASREIPLSFALKDHLLKISNKGQWSDVEKFSKSLYLKVKRQESIFYARSAYSKRGRSLASEGFNLLEIESAINDCFESSDDRRELYSVAHITEECNYLRDWRLAFSEKSEALDSRIFSHFSPTSDEANNLLSVKHYLRSCLGLYSEAVDSNLDGEEWINRCTYLSELDLSLQLTQTLTKNYSSLIGEENSKLILDEYLQCFQAVEPELTEFEEFNQLISSDSLSFQNKELLSEYFGESSFSRDQIFVAGNILERLGPKTIFHESEIAKCERSYRNHLMESMSDFMHTAFPGGHIGAGSDGSEIHNDILSHLLDPEIVSLFVEISSSIERERDYLDFYSYRAGDKIATPLLGKVALRNLVETIVSGIEQGMAFDKPTVERELVIFKEELKDALRWMRNSGEVVPLSDLNRFFSESRLADYLALAEVAKSTRRQLLEFVDHLKRDEVLEFRRATRFRAIGSLNARDRENYKGIIQKYNNINEMIELMTKSYDFRRLMRVSEREGQELLDKIKKYKLLPELFGDHQLEVTFSGGNQSIDEEIAKFIIQDDAIGGFVEQFVEQIANHHLSVDRQNRWRVTKFLFYSEADFDWTKLRETPSGRSAIRYYAQNILLPNMMNVEFSATAIRHHREYFEELVLRARGER